MTRWRKWKKALSGRACAGLLALALIASMTVGAGAESYMQPYLDKVLEWGVMRGDIEGNLNEDNPITRAEFATMINRAFGYDNVSATPFRDVAETAWYADDVGIAYRAGYIQGTSASTFSPDNNITRQEAAVILARILVLPAEVGENTLFTDSRTMENWSKGYIASIARQGIMQGYPDGRFGPEDNLTRGQAAILLVNALGTPVQTAGTHTLGSVWGNVTISTSGATLRDTVIGGNLYITAGVDLGYVTLENVTVLGDIVVSGGGVSEGGADSVILRNVNASRMVVDNIGNRFVSLKVEGESLIDRTFVRTSAYLADNTAQGQGMTRIDLDGEEGISLSLAGNIKEVVNSAPGTTLALASGQAQTITVDEAAVGSSLFIASGARVENVNLDTGIKITGTGDIANLTVNASGSTVTMLPDQIVIRPDVTANIDGQVMDSAAAAESSADPRLYAGYPSITDLAPTSASAAFSANKRGTVYWAVTAVTDGSVSAEELIHPSSYSPKVVKSGTVSLTGAGKEATAKISGLTTNGAYYLSAVFVDARDERSPLKVISFTTPDNTKPAFATGYPYMSKISSISAQATAMATKTCRMYYALLPKGASAPTGDDFKANAVTGNLGFGSMDVLKNTAYTFRVNSVPLEELESYDLYLWLTDVDGGQSSAVKKVSFSTVDGTPPVFNTEPTVNSVKETSVGLYANLNEAGTLYWVIVKEGTSYPKPVQGEGEVDLSSETAKLQVMAGMNALKSGKVSMTQDKDVSFSISGLEKEAAYDLYYVAQDKAGNYSATVGKITIHTLDNNAPTVKQEFTKYNGTDTSAPLPDSDIRLVFSEAVQAMADYMPLAQLYQDVLDAIKSGSAAEMAAREKMALALSEAIYFYQVPSSGQPVQIQGYTGSNKENDDWVIDYRYARIELEDGKTVITFSNEEGAINLRSGATYYFEIQAKTIADTSTAANPMGRTELDRFTTVFAVVNLSALNENTITTYLDDAGHPQTPVTPVAVDLSWRLSPVATDKVDDSIDWDMIIWSDTSVEFALYAREVGETDGQWKLLGNNKIDLSSSVAGYLGISLTRNFLQQGSSNPDFDALNTLDPDTDYDFAISFTKVGGMPDRDTWSQRVNMRVQVAAGSNNNLGTLTADIREETWEEMLKEGITNVGQPDAFSLRKQFTDQKAPSFTGDYPIFEAGDSAVKMSLQLDRTGTIYYVIAPLGFISTTDGKNSFDDNTTGVTNWMTLLPDSGKELNSEGGKNPEPPKLTAPDYLSIVNGSSNYRNEKIKCGTLSGGPSTVEELVEGLEPDTKYIAYFVLQGTAQTYSEYVLAYRFATTPATKPVISLEADPPSVHFKTDISAELTYVLVANNQIPSSWRTANGFDNYIDDDPKVKAAWEAYKRTLSTDTDRTIIWALCTKQGDKGYSVFDQFANDTIRENVSNYISGNSGQGSNVAARGGKTLTQSNSYMDSQDFTDNMTGDTIYYCISMAYSPLGSATSFAGVNGVFIPDLTPPAFVSVDTKITGSTTGGYPTYSGTVTFTFDEPVYQLVKDESGVEQTPMEVWQTTATLEGWQQRVAVRLIDILATSIDKSKLSYVNELKKPSNSLTLKFKNISVGDTITFFSDSSISDQYSNSMGSLTFKAEAQPIGNVPNSYTLVFVLQGQ